MSRDKYFKGYNPDFLSSYGKRDWQKDMELVEKFKYSQTLCNGIQPTFHGMISMPEPVEIALEYWLQQYAAEKERADKLQEAINQAIKEYGLWNDKALAADVMAILLAEVRSSLYPKEETKP